MGIDGASRDKGVGSGDQQSLVASRPKRGEISTGYVNVADGDPYHGGGRGLSLKFGFREGKPYGLMVGSVWSATGQKIAQRTQKH